MSSFHCGCCVIESGLCLFGFSEAFGVWGEANKACIDRTLLPGIPTSEYCRIYRTNG